MSNVKESIIKEGGLSKTKVDKILKEQRKEEKKRNWRTAEQIRQTRNGVLKVLFKKHGWTVQQLALATGLSYMQIHNVVYGKKRKDR